MELMGVKGGGTPGEIKYTGIIDNCEEIIFSIFLNVIFVMSLLVQNLSILLSIASF